MIGVLQENVANQAGSGTTLVFTITGVTAGSGLSIRTLHNYFSASISSVVSDVGGALTARGTVQDAATAREGGQYTLNTAAAGSHQITVTLSGSTNQCSAVWREIGETSGYQASASPNVQATPGVSTDGVSSSSATAASQPALVDGFTWNGTTVAATAGTGFTAGQNADTSAAGGRARTEHKRITATGASAATFTAPSDDVHLSSVLIWAETVASTAKPALYYARMRT